MDQLIDDLEQKPRRRGRPRTRGITTQMNVRVDKDLKVRGDEVLRAAGSNPTDVISRLWGYVVRTGSVPDFLSDDQLDELAARNEQLNVAIGDARGMVWRMLEEAAAVPQGAGHDLSADDVRTICSGGNAARAKEVAL